MLAEKLTSRSTRNVVDITKSGADDILSQCLCSPAWIALVLMPRAGVPVLIILVLSLRCRLRTTAACDNTFYTLCIGRRDRSVTEVHKKECFP
jgi:hypothetical protein